ncbi:uncharacterized protein E0L32_003865 [Thyridium curvatum]|uniref:SWI5-dependent HO expression protein 3 n=1 Tax=Thyridium curvatum TaxID=1093900 RepID=A0A507BHU7_9PEZI|nr:uncharacterized protein E0L32_003865 [Thyridium curvatum]TPX16571.1 hypothetical protein E0L32_003865 [Thyridium curvatum]
MNSRSMANGSLTVQPEGKSYASGSPSVGLSPRSARNGQADVVSRKMSIRAVPSFSDRTQGTHSEDDSSDGSPSIPRHSNSAFSSSLNSNMSGMSAISQQPSKNTSSSSTVRKKQSATGDYLDVHDRASDVPSRTPSPGARSRSSVEIPRRESSLGVTGRSRSPGAHAPAVEVHYADGSHHEEGPGSLSQSSTDQHLGNGWDSTVGKAGLGKTGRVINRLVSDNETLKRDLKIERLKAEESRQAARLLEDKMERLVSDYESRLLDANVTKTLLSRKERQVESLQAAVELEKKRTADAQERERTWREEMEKTRSESKRQVDEATSYALLMEGRYNAISSHWRDQGDDVKRAMGRMGKEIQDLLDERRSDDDKITVLRELCDQQNSNLDDLRQQKDDISRKFEDYKTEQERALHDIKTKAAARESQQEQTLREAKEVLDKLRWALNVKATVAGAQ